VTPGGQSFRRRQQWLLKRQQWRRYKGCILTNSVLVSRFAATNDAAAAADGDDDNDDEIGVMFSTQTSGSTQVEAAEGRCR